MHLSGQPTKEDRSPEPACAGNGRLLPHVQRRAGDLERGVRAADAASALRAGGPAASRAELAGIQGVRR